MRNGVSAAIRQCLYRYQEQLLSGNTRAAEHIIEVLGPEDGQRVVRVLKNERFDEHVSVELTAASVSTNKEADRQNAIILVNILTQYYQRILELAVVAVNPQTPPAIKKVVEKIASAAGEIIDRTIRTFDQVRDPGTFIINLEEGAEFDQMSALAGGLQQLLGGAAPAQSPVLPAP